jgi:hypothetical protein
MIVDRSLLLYEGSLKHWLDGKAGSGSSCAQDEEVPENLGIKVI